MVVDVAVQFSTSLLDFFSSILQIVVEIRTCVCSYTELGDVISQSILPIISSVTQSFLGSKSGDKDGK